MLMPFLSINPALSFGKRSLTRKLDNLQVGDFHLSLTDSTVASVESDVPLMFEWIAADANGLATPNL
jgi:hypothetical protein